MSAHDYPLNVPRRRAAMARVQFENALRNIAPLIAKSVERRAAEWERDHPAVRTCLFCKRRHRNPRLVWEIRGAKRTRRWASRKCIEAHFGPQSRTVAYGGMTVYQVHR